uniref:Histidine acid phosphatase n=1 Tax=Bursaphelenchus xylophilus TaxID=6326 RepID=A0A1I7S4J5_BURXY
MTAGFWIFFILALILRTGAVDDADVGDDVQIEQRTLIYVQVVFRHGDRTPQKLSVDVPSGVPREWSRLGPDQLTSLGLSQGYYLGEVIKKRYAGFISPTFKEGQVSVRSSDFGRTISTAQGVLGGMFGATFNASGFIEQGIRMKSKYNDKEMYYHTPCSNAEKERDRVLQEEEDFTKLRDEYSNLLTIMAKHSNSSKEILGLEDVFAVADSINVLKLHNLTVPSWVTPTVWDGILKIHERVGYGLFENDFLKRLRAGPLVNNVLRRMHNYIVGIVDHRQKIRLLSGHDTTLTALLSTWQIPFEEAPELCSALAIELHYHRNFGYFVKFFHRNETNGHVFYEVKSNLCGETCMLKRLVNVSEKYIPQNWLKECGFVDEFVTMVVKQSERKYIWILVFQTLIFVLVLVVAGLRWFGRRIGQNVIHSSLKNSSMNEMNVLNKI